MHRSVILLASATLVLGAAEIRYEAEGSSDAISVADAACSGGSAARSDKAWQPLLIAPTPDSGQAFTLWIHHKGGPLCLKAAPADGAQEELGWVWDRPTAWTWTRLGRFDRAQLGQRIYLIRDDGGEQLLDCLVLRSDDLATPPEARR